MLSVSEMRAIQEREARRQQRRYLRDDLVEATTRWQTLCWHRDGLRKKIEEVGARRDLAPFDRQIMVGQLRATLAAVESDLVTARAQAEGLRRAWE